METRDSVKAFIEVYEEDLRRKLAERFENDADYMAPGIMAYVIEGVGPGDFLGSVLSNDLMGAFLYGDPTNRGRMLTFTWILRHDIPWECRGSRSAVKEWKAIGGLKGRMEAQAAS